MSAEMEGWQDPEGRVSQARGPPDLLAALVTIDALPASPLPYDALVPSATEEGVWVGAAASLVTATAEAHARSGV